MEVVKGYVKLSNVEMYYEMAGAGEPLLLIHGIDSDSRMWEPQFNEFSQHFQTIRIDLRGFGKTIMPAGEFQLLDDLYDLLNELKIEKAHILGYSYGGTVAPSFTIKYPEKVKSLILTSAGMVGHRWSDEVSVYFKRFQETYSENNYEEMMKLLKWKSVYGPYRKEEGLDEICQLLDQMFLHALAIVPRDGKPLPTGDTRELLHTINVPTLILVGELDFEDYHQMADFYHQQIQNSQIVVVPNVAHFMNLENPKLFNQTVINFLNDLYL
ncbi:alpha/beta fold hydrolase [Bacillus sp. CGMCC 1.16607]|uniref:alpha/beta fold hydrolase n=1 Tax=Bacillus sp. CGMCC 1.16607 TaxID=3351842 RepID=UPI00364237DA